MDTEALKALVEKATEGPWRRKTMGGCSTVLSAQEPGRNDNRIPAYGYDHESGYCLAYPFLDDNDKTRLDFVCFSHEDAALIAQAPTLAREVLRQADAITALSGEVEQLTRLETAACKRLAAYNADLQAAEADAQALREKLSLAADFIESCGYLSYATDLRAALATPAERK